MPLKQEQGYDYGRPYFTAKMAECSLQLKKENASKFSKQYSFSHLFCMAYYFIVTERYNYLVNWILKRLVNTRTVPTSTFLYSKFCKCRCVEQDSVCIQIFQVKVLHSSALGFGRYRRR